MSLPWLTTIGLLPTEAEARTFFDSRDPAKRTKVIDGLLQRPEFAELWALKLSELSAKAPFRIRVPTPAPFGTVALNCTDPPPPGDTTPIWPTGRVPPSPTCQS